MVTDGSRLERRFLKDAKFHVVYDFLKSKGVNMTGKRLMSMYPRKEYSDQSQTLSEAGTFRVTC